ncbi:MAG: hypothetical protein A3J28_02705 [Acidobacteria bacterium RIFCSPLOWO2_12_FULL_60_22]|nr:MAG: hypothetical protein A3J28_02705 [Acidobacteria bacterium RIFCSPLOWO2_12_FULL_60_22]
MNFRKLFIPILLRKGEGLGQRGSHANRSARHPAPLLCSNAPLFYIIPSLQTAFSVPRRDSLSSFCGRGVPQAARESGAPTETALFPHPRALLANWDAI